MKTAESVEDLAGYLDTFYSMYAIRDNHHPKTTEFASATLNRYEGDAQSGDGYRWVE